MKQQKDFTDIEKYFQKNTFWQDLGIMLVMLVICAAVCAGGLWLVREVL